MGEATYSPALQIGVPFGVRSSKEGHSCCGGCCDMRRATIIVNIITIILSMIVIVFVIERIVLLDRLYYDNTAKMFEVVKGISNPVLIFILCAYSVCLAIGISGAISYNKNFVVVSLIAYCVKCGIAAYMNDPMVVITQALFAYPNAVLVKEIKDGIMTPHNYENEKQSCCCV
mmetsp:Transcript_4345/g.6617  ORF Transcript_4345/g.6617 Transcript_4345/m.6617 type:complete len:173 (-) Transcript_4345:162-680(-)